MEIKTRRPWGIRIEALTREEFLHTIISWAREKNRPRLVTYQNAHCINLYFKDADYARIIDQADLVYADGQAVVWASRVLKESLPERISAADFFHEFCELCEKENLSLFFLGSGFGVAEKAAENLKQSCPQLNISGARHGFFSLPEIPPLVSEIKEAKPDILLVGMGAPRQEQFAFRHFKELRVPVVWCVGALFEYVAGITPRAPVWMRRLGLEWLFRLALEPRRLWRRYLPGNVCFLWKVLLRSLKHTPPTPPPKK